MKYTIGFKSGNRLELELNDGEQFIYDIAASAEKTHLHHFTYM